MQISILAFTKLFGGRLGEGKKSLVAKFIVPDCGIFNFIPPDRDYELSLEDQRGQCTLFFVVFTPPPTATTSVFSFTQCWNFWTIHGG
jgi:hypothetical protein